MTGEMRELRTDRLVLRPWRDDDAGFLLDLYGRDDVVRHLGATSRVTTREGALASIARRRGVFDTDPHGIWLVAGTDGRPLGNLLLKPIPGSGGADTGEVEIGWHLHPDAQGRGVATEAARAVLADAAARGLRRVVAVTHPDNHASQRVCGRLGMRHEGRTRRYYDAELELFTLALDAGAGQGPA